MDLVFDIDVALSVTESVIGPTARPADQTTALGRWYEWSYDETDHARGATASTAELLAYGWGERDARDGRPRQDATHRGAADHHRQAADLWPAQRGRATRGIC